MKRKVHRRKISGIKVIVFVILMIAFVFMAYKAYLYIDIRLQKAVYPIKYYEQVEKYSNEYGVPEEIIYSVIKVESNFKKNATSNKGACGLMQLMPDTFNWLCSKAGESYHPLDIYDENINIKYGTYYLSILYSLYSNWDTALAAYNAGIGNVKKWLNNDEYSKDGKLINIPINETRNYVIKVNNAIENYLKLYG